MDSERPLASRNLHSARSRRPASLARSSASIRSPFTAAAAEDSSSECTRASRSAACASTPPSASALKGSIGVSFALPAAAARAPAVPGGARLWYPAPLTDVKGRAGPASPPAAVLPRAPVMSRGPVLTPMGLHAEEEEGVRVKHVPQQHAQRRTGAPCHENAPARRRALRAHMAALERSKPSRGRGDGGLIAGGGREATCQAARNELGTFHRQTAEERSSGAHLPSPSYKSSIVGCCVRHFFNRNAVISCDIGP